MTNELADLTIIQISLEDQAIFASIKLFQPISSHILQNKTFIPQTGYLHNSIEFL
jgi:hypothetical protein